MASHPPGGDPKPPLILPHVATSLGLLSRVSELPRLEYPASCGLSPRQCAEIIGGGPSPGHGEAGVSAPHYPGPLPPPPRALRGHAHAAG